MAVVQVNEFEPSNLLQRQHVQINIIGALKRKMFYMCTFCNVTITSIIGYDNRVSERTLVVSLHHLHDLYQSKLIDIHKMVHVMTVIFS